jgi:putative NIF3 family GTP cyclohydrolase 1 type 2
MQLAKVLELQQVEPTDPDDPTCLIWQGKLPTPMTGKTFAAHLQEKLGRVPLHCPVLDRPLETLAWCTGGAQDYIDSAATLKVDAYLTGEVSERTVHSARELGIEFFSAGHHATERYGVKALGEHLVDCFDLDVEFIDIDNPA